MPTEQKKILYLHGFGESSLLAGQAAAGLEKALSSRGIKLDISLDGFVKLKSDVEFEPIVDEEYKKMCKNGDLDAFAWYMLKKGSEGGHREPPAEDFGFRGDRKEQIEAVMKLCKHIDSIGGVDGLVGFSQGGELAYLLAENTWRLSASSKERLRFIGTFGSEDTFNQRGIPPTQIPADIRFFICFGDGDKDAAYDSKTAQKALDDAGAVQVVVHSVAGLDHHMPKPGAPAYDAMLALLDDALKGEKLEKPPPPKEDLSKLSKEELCKRFGVDPKLLVLAAYDPSREVQLTPDERLAEYERLGGEVWRPTIPKEAPPGWGQGYANGQKWLDENKWE